MLASIIIGCGNIGQSILQNYARYITSLLLFEELRRDKEKLDITGPNAFS
jgi:saccharopine dehydrogenase-like NADP-dependent oxidoreductase